MLGSLALHLLTALWTDHTAESLGPTAEWSNKVVVADVDDDGDLDVVFANGGDYASAGTPEPNRVFLGDGKGAFVDATTAVFGPTPDAARVVEARDLDGDGHTDLFVGTTWESQSRLFRGLGDGQFEEVTATALPQGPLSVGDVAVGDVDGDGDLDLLLAHWGAGDPLSNAGGRTQLWLNDGAGHFEDATETHTPNALIRFSWELELADVDNDADLDALISCKTCKGSRLFRNDGAGHLLDAPGLEKVTNNYEFEVMDVTGDGYVDLVTINDGPGLAERLLVNDGDGAFADESEERWEDNPGEDDNVAVFLDFDADGDADVLIGSLSGDDRLYRNDDGALVRVEDPFDTQDTPGTLGLAVGDLDGDRRLDVVNAQGEVAFDDRVYLATDGVAVDTTAPSVAVLSVEDDRLVARVHDRVTPTRDHLFARVEVTATPMGGGEPVEHALRWMGEALFAAPLALAVGEWTLVVCAVDRAGNEACADPVVHTVTEPPPPVDPGPTPDAPEPADGPGPTADDPALPDGPGPTADDPEPTADDPPEQVDADEREDAGADTLVDAGSSAGGSTPSGGCGAAGRAGPGVLVWPGLLGLAVLSRRRAARHLARRRPEPTR